VDSSALGLKGEEHRVKPVPLRPTATRTDCG
jgi:hypothetical protein